MIKLPRYITAEEVRRVCRQIGVRDWTRLRTARITTREAQVILKLVNTEKMPIDVAEFRAGLAVELEHGTRYPDANVTCNHPVVTGMIVLAHLKESLDYYKLLEVAELEGDLLKAVVRGNAVKIKAVYKKLAAARISLHKAETRRLGQKACLQ